MEHYIFKPPPPPPSRPVESDGESDSDTSEQFEPEQALSAPKIAGASPDEVAKWIEERRRNWPSAKRTAERAAAAAAAQSAPAAQADAETGKRRGAVCKYFQTGSCKLGGRCKFLHEKEAKRYKRFEAPAPDASLYRLLVSQDIDKENETILDFITLLYAHGSISNADIITS